MNDILNEVERLGAEQRRLATLQVFARQIREGAKYREACKALEEAEARGDSLPCLQMLRFACALYAPFPETKEA